MHWPQRRVGQALPLKGHRARRPRARPPHADFLRGSTPHRAPRGRNDHGMGGFQATDPIQEEVAIVTAWLNRTGSTGHGSFQADGFARHHATEPLRSADGSIQIDRSTANGLRAGNCLFRRIYPHAVTPWDRVQHSRDQRPGPLTGRAPHAQPLCRRMGSAPWLFTTLAIFDPSSVLNPMWRPRACSSCPHARCVTGREAAGVSPVKPAR